MLLKSKQQPTVLASSSHEVQQQSEERENERWRVEGRKIALENSKIASNVRTNERMQTSLLSTDMDMQTTYMRKMLTFPVALFTKLCSLPNAIFVIHFSHKIMKSFEKTLKMHCSSKIASNRHVYTTYRCYQLLECWTEFMS